MSTATKPIFELPPARMVREIGEIKAFDHKRGFGFIAVDATPARDYFAHISEFHGIPNACIKRGEPVEFYFVAHAPCRPRKSPRAYDIRLLREWL